MIQILNVSKKFRIWEDRSRDLKETAINLLKGKRRSYRDLWALRGISLEIGEGETVAFIGENGSGKSTMLKLLCGIYVPDEGKIATRGKISSLLDLGIGFHPDLTGEENIYLNGAMLGFNRREMRKKFDEIVSFAEIGDFIYSPIRTYSSGMTMRLGFSVAMCVDPDILVIDEVLAVGDEAFQEKCFGRLEDFKSAGKTIMIVTHSLEAVEKFCARAVLLHRGQVVADGEPGRTIEAYHALLLRRMGSELELRNGEGMEGFVEQERTREEGLEKDLSSCGALNTESSPPLLPFVVRKLWMTDRRETERESFDVGETVRVKIVVESQKDEEPGIGIGIVREDASPVYGVSNLIDQVRPSKIGKNLYGISIEFPHLNLLPGRYVVRGHCGDSSGTQLFHTVEKNLAISGESREFGVCRLNHRWQTFHHGSSKAQKSE